MEPKNLETGYRLAGGNRGRSLRNRPRPHNGFPFPVLLKSSSFTCWKDRRQVLQTLQRFIAQQHSQAADWTVRRCPRPITVFHRVPIRQLASPRHREQEIAKNSQWKSFPAIKFRQSGAWHLDGCFWGTMNGRCIPEVEKRAQTGRSDQIPGTAELRGSDSSVYSAAVSRWVSLPTRHFELRSDRELFCCEPAENSDKLLDDRSESPFLSEQRLARPPSTDR